jgi:signal transduction histidine kinase
MRLPRREEIWLAVAVGIVQLTATTLAARHQHDRASLDVAGYVLLAVGPIALLWRRVHPLAVLGVAAAAALAYWLTDHPRGPIFLALIVALLSAVARGHRLAGWLTLLGGFAGFLWLPALIGADDGPTLGAVAGLAAWLLVLGAVAEGLRVRGERLAERAAAREQEAQRRIGEERLRISRELHDLLAHNVSLINVQSSVALHLIDERPEQAREALAAIKRASADTLREMRTVLGALRAPDEAPSRTPAPSLAQLDELVAQVRAAGIEVRARVEGEPRPLPAAVDLAAYRIVQEALTNVTRHAGGAGAAVRVSYGPGTLELDVDDDGAGPTGTWDGDRHGNGIVGMGERAAALGGELQAGPRPGGGFRVHARLPLEAS